MNGMRVGIDARMIRHSGIGSYVRGLLGAYAAAPGRERFVVFVPEGETGEVPAVSHFEVHTSRVPVYSLAEHAAWPRQVDAAGCDLLHVPHYNSPWTCRTPLVVTIHDVVHWLYPEYLRTPLHAWVARRWLAHSGRRAAHVLTGAQSAAADVQRVLAIEPERMTVVPHGLEPRFRPPAPEAVAAFRAQWSLPSSFFLYLGLQRPHKNLARLVRAFAQYRAASGSGTGTALVLWGRRDGRDPDLDAALRMYADGVTLRDAALAPQDVPLLYAASRALVQPSLYEGFGLPPLEAMACGVPVVCSDGGALPEVVGDAALVVPRHDVDTMAAALERVAHDDALRAQLVKRGRERAARYTWDEAARATRRVYARVAARSGVTV